MKEIKWNKHFNLGVESIDKAHQKLFSIVGKLVALNEDPNKQQHACREGIKYFNNYAHKHFSEEEAYMKSINYSGYDIHKSLHDDMRDQTLPALEKELEKQNYSVESVRHFIGICIGWLTGHIMIEDYAITGRMPNKWTHQPTENHAESLQKAIVQVIDDLFRVDARLISHHYSGEDFSNKDKLCYRFTYKTKEGKHLCIYLVYEERIALFSLSQMFGKDIKKTDSTILYAINILSQQFLKRIGAHFQYDALYEFEKYDVLTFDQFLKTFDKTYPAYSLLFSTGGKGYFAFCADL